MFIENFIAKRYLILNIKFLDHSGGIRHTESRHSRIAVIRESDLPFTKMGNYEKSDVISYSYGNFNKIVECTK